MDLTALAEYGVGIFAISAMAFIFVSFMKIMERVAAGRTAMLLAIIEMLLTHINKR